MACPVLPAELWVSVLAHLEFREILRCQEVCKSFCEIVASSGLLQYLIQLGVYGYVDLSPKHDLNIPDRLAYLLKYHSEWRTPKLECRKTQRIDHEIPARARWHPEKFHDGILAVGHKDHSNYAPYHDDWKTEFYFMFNEISVFRIDSHNSTHYTKYQLGDFFGLFEFDVLEDVLLVARCPATPRSSHVLLKPLSLSEDFQHPKAHAATIHVPCHSSAITNFRLCGELVAFSMRTSGIVLVNWMTGASRNISFSPLLPVASDLCFISTSHLAVFDGWSHQPRLQLCSMDPRSLDSTMSSVVLELPCVFPTLTIEKDRMSCSLSRSPSRNHPSPDADLLTFHPSPARADLLCIHLTISSSPGNEEEDTYYRRQPGSHTYTAIISVAGILDLLAKTVSPSPPSVLPWDYWGPSRSRWFEGLKLISQDDLHTPTSGFRVFLKDRVLDFNAVEIAREFAGCGCRLPFAHWTDVHLRYPDVSPNFYCERHKDVVAKASGVPYGVPFMQNVVSGLPYRKAVELGQSRRLRDSDWAYMDGSLVRQEDEEGTIVFHFLDI